MELKIKIWRKKSPWKTAFKSWRVFRVTYFKVSKSFELHIPNSAVRYSEEGVWGTVFCYFVLLWASMRADPESLFLPKFLYSWYFYIIILKRLNHSCCPLELSFAQWKTRTYIFGIYVQYWDIMQATGN